MNLIEDEIKKGFFRVKEPAELMEAEHRGKGELNAISLARQEGLPLIIDDRKARIIGISNRIKSVASVIFHPLGS